MDTKVLEDIGLSTAEIKIYLSLLELGSTTAGPLIEKSGLQSSVVYNAIQKLTAKGFLAAVQQGKKHHYSAADPRHITRYIDEKKIAFESILPTLLIKQQNAKESPQVVAFEGIKGVRELLETLLDASGKEHHTIGSAQESLMLGEAFWVDYHKRRAAKGIKAKLLFNESLQRWAAETKYPNAEVRYTQAGFEPLTETIIRGERIGIIVWTEKPIGILIKNVVAAKSYDQYFQVLWQQTAGRAPLRKR